MTIWCMTCGLEQDCPIAVWYCRCPVCNGRCFKWGGYADYGIRLTKKNKIGDIPVQLQTIKTIE